MSGGFVRPRGTNHMKIQDAVCANLPVAVLLVPSLKGVATFFCFPLHLSLFFLSISVLPISFARKGGEKRKKEGGQKGRGETE